MNARRLLQLLAVPPTLLLIGNLASADVITGRVVDSNGVGVAGVDIDFVTLGGGGNPHEANDGTDANGDFFTTVDPGVYEIRFYPPNPPTTVLLTGVVTPVTVTGTKNMGTITLVTGASVQGTCKNPANQPVGGIRLNVFHANTGAQYHLKNNVTGAFGTFNLAMPKNIPLRVEYLTNAVVGQVLVPAEAFGTIPASINLGTIPFQTGFHVTGTVHRQNGTPVVGADVDVTFPANGATLFTPSDNTDSLGAFDVVVPAGLWDLDIDRPTGAALVGIGFNDLSISAATNLGILTMRNGVFLSGTIRDRLHDPVLAADVNVFEVATGLSVSLGSDNSNAAGFYSVVVPTGLLDIAFTPPGNTQGFGRDWHRGVNVTVNTVLNGRVGELARPRADVLPPEGQPSILTFGQGSPGAGGAVPHIGGTLTPAGVTLQLDGAHPEARARLWVGLEEHPSPAMDGVRIVNPLARLPLAVDAAGTARITLPYSAELLGQTVYVQFAVIDREAHGSVAVSHVLALTLSE